MSLLRRLAAAPAALGGDPQAGTGVWDATTAERFALSRLGASQRWMQAATEICARASVSEEETAWQAAAAATAVPLALSRLAAASAAVGCDPQAAAFALNMDIPWMEAKWREGGKVA